MYPANQKLKQQLLSCSSQCAGQVGRYSQARSLVQHCQQYSCFKVSGIERGSAGSANAEEDTQVIQRQACSTGGPLAAQRSLCNIPLVVLRAHRWPQFHPPTSEPFSGASKCNQFFSTPAFLFVIPVSESQYVTLLCATQRSLEHVMFLWLSAGVQTRIR